MKPRRDITVSGDLKEQFGEFAHQNRTTMGALVGRFVEEYAAGKIPSSPTDPSGYGTNDTKLKFVADDAVWKRAMERARSEGTTLPKQIRARIQSVL